VGDNGAMASQRRSGTRVEEFRPLIAVPLFVRTGLGARWPTARVRGIRARVRVIHGAAAPVNGHVKVFPSPPPEKFNTFNTFNTFDATTPSPGSTGRVPTKWVAGRG
jgi:hypothetical protein